MKRFLGLLLCILMAAGICGCGLANTDESTLKISKDGSVTGIFVEAFDKDIYDKDELYDYVNSLVDEYSASYSGIIKVKSLNVKNDYATLLMKYDTAATYEEFSSETLFVGTVAEALASGYEFEGLFYGVTKGETSDATMSESSDASGDMTASSDAVYGNATSDDVLSGLDLRVVITSESYNVKVPGDICYVSAKGTKVLSKNTVSVGDNDGLCYIVYSE